MGSLAWFITAFFLSICALIAAAYLAQRQERHRDLQEQLQTLSQDVALGRFRHALNDLQHLPFSSLHQEEIDLLKTQCFKGLGDRHALFEHLQRAISHAPKSTSHLLDLALFQVEEARYQQALEIYRCLPQNVLFTRALLPFSEALFAQGELQACIEALSHYEGQPSAQVFSLIGQCHFHLQAPREALDYIEKAKNLGERSLALLECQAFCLMRFSRYEEALRVWQELFTANAHHDGVILEMSLCMLHTGKYKEALRIYENAPNWLQQKPRFHADLGHCYFHLKQYKKAVHHLLTAYELGDSRPQIMVTCAIAMERQKLWRHAQCLYEQLTQEHPQHHSGWAGLSYLFGIGKCEGLAPEQAISMAQKAVRLLPCRPAWEILSAVFARSGRFDRAHDIQESLQHSLQGEIACVLKEERKEQQKQEEHQLNQITMDLIALKEKEVSKHREVMRNLRKKRPPSLRQVPHILCA